MAVVVTKQRTIAHSTKPLPVSGPNPNTHSIQSGRMGVMTEKTPLTKAKPAVTQNRRLTFLAIAASISPLSRTGCLRPLGALSLSARPSRARPFQLSPKPLSSTWLGSFHETWR
jgi:hypothetical protein